MHDLCAPMRSANSSSEPKRRRERAINQHKCEAIKFHLRSVYLHFWFMLLAAMLLSCFTWFISLFGECWSWARRTLIGAEAFTRYDKEKSRAICCARWNRNCFRNKSADKRRRDGKCTRRNRLWHVRSWICRRDSKVLACKLLFNRFWFEIRQRILASWEMRRR